MFDKEKQYALHKEHLVIDIFERGFSIEALKKGTWVSENEVGKIVYQNSNTQQSLPIRPFFYINENIARFVAIVLAECYVDRSQIVLYHTSEQIINLFTEFCKELGLPIKHERAKNEWKITVRKAGTLMKVLHDAFEVPIYENRKSSHVTMPKVIQAAPMNILAAYIGAYIDCEGYVAKHRSTLEITSASEKNIIQLGYSFLRIGVNGSFSKAYGQATNSSRPKKRMYHTLTITGVPFLKTILEKVPITDERKKKRLQEVTSGLTNTNNDVIPVGSIIRSLREQGGYFQRDLGIQGTITDYEDGSTIPSRVALGKIVRTFETLCLENNKELTHLQTLAKSDIFWEKVVSIKKEDGYQGYVYDLTIKEMHNFIAGQGAFIVHNTTTSMNLSAYLAMNGKKTLLVDFDPQSNATAGMGVTHAPHETMYHALLAGVPVESVVKNTQLSNFWMIPSSQDLAGALIEIVEVENREWLLRKALQKIASQYDFIVIDLAPSLNLLTINGLLAADEVIIPVQCEYFSLEGLSQLLSTIEMLKNNLNHPLKVAGALLTMYDKRERLSREVAREVRRRFPHVVYSVEIPRSVSLAEAPSFRKPVVLYNPQSSGALAYERLAREVIGEKERESLALTTEKDFNILRLI